MIARSAMTRAPGFTMRASSAGTGPFETDQLTLSTVAKMLAQAVFGGFSGLKEKGPDTKENLASGPIVTPTGFEPVLPP